MTVIWRLTCDIFILEYEDFLCFPQTYTIVMAVPRLIHSLVVGKKVQSRLGSVPLVHTQITMATQPVYPF